MTESIPNNDWHTLPVTCVLDKGLIQHYRFFDYHGVNDWV
jgi:hypothetical protein